MLTDVPVRLPSSTFHLCLQPSGCTQLKEMSKWSRFEAARCVKGLNGYAQHLVWSIRSGGSIQQVAECEGRGGRWSSRYSYG